MVYMYIIGEQVVYIFMWSFSRNNGLHTGEQVHIFMWSFSRKRQYKLILWFIAFVCGHRDEPVQIFMRSFSRKG